MIILNCPKCSEAVTMASGMRPTSKVRCPLCQEDYVLADALGKLPPSLIPLDEPAADDDERPVEPTWETSGGEAENLKGEATPSFAFDAAARGTATAAAGAPRLVTRPRPKSKPKNPMIEVVKVVGGGIAGLLIAQLILWWFPVKKYRRDPFEFGPKVANISWLKFLVPQDYWPDAKNDDLTSGGGGGGFGAGIGGGGLGKMSDDNSPAPQSLGKTPVDWNAVIAPKPGTSSGGSSGSPTENQGDLKNKGGAKSKTTEPSDDLILDDVPLKPSASASDPLGGVKIDLDRPAAKPAPANPPRTSKPATVDEPDDATPDAADPGDAPKPKAKPAAKVNDEPTESTEPTADSPKSATASTDPPKPADVRQQVTATRAAANAWLNSGQTDRNERRRLGEAFHGSLTRLAEVTADPSPSDLDDAAAIRASIDQLGRETLAEPALAGLVEFLARQRLVDPNSAGRGLALVGKLSVDSDTTEHPHLVIELQGKEPVVALVVVPADSPLLLKAGQRVFVLGVVATKPEDHRDDGDQRPVVLSSPNRVVVAPAAAEPVAAESDSAK